MASEDIHSAIVLCGGMSRRMGEDKGSMLIHNIPMIIHVLESLNNQIDEVVIVLNNVERIHKYKLLIEKYLNNSKKNFNFKMNFLEDEIKNKGPLSGIMTGLKNISSDYGVILPCDSPFINSTFIKNMFEIFNSESNSDSNYNSNFDSKINSNSIIEGFIPYHEEFCEKQNKEEMINNSEPLHSIYKKDISKDIEILLKKDEKQVKAIIKLINAVFVPITKENNIKKYNFRNINYKKDIKKLQCNNPIQ